MCFKVAVKLEVMFLNGHSAMFGWLYARSSAQHEVGETTERVNVSIERDLDGTNQPSTDSPTRMTHLIAFATSRPRSSASRDCSKRRRAGWPVGSATSGRAADQPQQRGLNPEMHTYLCI